MSDTSHVSLERKLCLVCATPYDTGAILLDRRLRQSLKPYTLTGWGLCPEHQRLYEAGFVALVECDPHKSDPPSAAGRLKPEQAYRTGRVAHLKREVFAQIFNVTINPDVPCAFVEPEVLEKLSLLTQP